MAILKNYARLSKINRHKGISKVPAVVMIRETRFRTLKGKQSAIKKWWATMTLMPVLMKTMSHQISRDLSFCGLLSIMI